MFWVQGNSPVSVINISYYVLLIKDELSLEVMIHMSSIIIYCLVHEYILRNSIKKPKLLTVLIRSRTKLQLWNSNCTLKLQNYNENTRIINN